MPDQDWQDWKAAAAAELREKLDAESRLIDTLNDQMRITAASRDEAAKRIAAIIDAASTLGIELAAPAQQEPADPKDPAAQALTAKDIILEALKAAYPYSMKSAELRKTIETKLGRSVHYKTPGMSLYRLAEDGQVRREGQNWFYVQQEEEAPYDL